VDAIARRTGRSPRSGRLGADPVRQSMDRKGTARHCRKSALLVRRERKHRCCAPESVPDGEGVQACRTPSLIRHHHAVRLQHGRRAPHGDGSTRRSDRIAAEMHVRDVEPGDLTSHSVHHCRAEQAGDARRGQPAACAYRLDREAAVEGGVGPTVPTDVERDLVAPRGECAALLHRDGQRTAVGVVLRQQRSHVCDSHDVDPKARVPVCAVHQGIDGRRVRRSREAPRRVARAARHRPNVAYSERSRRVRLR
jgi:hypothetical protein